jgi:hypothetical protein
MQLGGSGWEGDLTLGHIPPAERERNDIFCLAKMSRPLGRKAGAWFTRSQAALNQSFVGLCEEELGGGYFDEALDEYLQMCFGPRERRPRTVWAQPKSGGVWENMVDHWPGFPAELRDRLYYDAFRMETFNRVLGFVEGELGRAQSHLDHLAPDFLVAPPPLPPLTLLLTPP